MSDKINKVRPSDPLIEQLQEQERQTKREQAKTAHEKTSTETLTHAGQNELLASVGKRICPESYAHVGSLCVHVYAHKMVENSAAFLCQISLPKGLAETAAQRAIKELTEHAMAFYGHTPPSKRGQPTKFDLTKLST